MVKRILGFFLFSLEILIIILLCLLFIQIKKYYPVIESYYLDAKKTVAECTTETFQKAQPTNIYSNDGKLLAELHTEQESIYVSYTELPMSVRDAFIAIEDKRFYKHKGVDFKSILKAIYLLIKNQGEIHRGGSSITQQLGRNIFLTHTKSFERKIREIFIAYELEQKFSKSEILEFYVNNVFYANSCYGIGAASKYYFDKDVNELSLAEVAYLCAIPNNPSYYNPKKYPEHVKVRKNTILNEMLEQGKISYNDWLIAINTPVRLVNRKKVFYDYESSYVIYCASKYLMQLDGFKFRYNFDSLADYKAYYEDYCNAYDAAKDELYTGGYSIKTSLNQKVQKKVQSVIDTKLAFNQEKEKEIYSFQGAATVIDNETGNVIAIVGGRSQKSKGYYTFNRAFQSFRQPGSTIKPLIVYTPALERNYTPDSIILDEPLESGQPHNAGNSYDGEISLRQAVEKSKNVVAWKIFAELEPTTGLSYLQDMHFAKITPQDYFLSASLGGLYYGVSLVEMTSGYAALANDGVFREPTCIISIKDYKGVELFRGTEAESVYNIRAAREMTDILQGVLKNGTGQGLALDSMPSAGKTGTTNDNTLGWFCGYTPYYTVGVWVGYDQNRSVEDLVGATYPGQIWKAIQEYLNDGKQIRNFRKATKKPMADEIDNSSETTIEETELTTKTISTETTEELTTESVSTDTIPEELTTELIPILSEETEEISIEEITEEVFEEETSEITTEESTVEIPEGTSEEFPSVESSEDITEEIIEEE